MWEKIGNGVAAAGRSFRLLQRLGYHRQLKQLEGKKAVFVLRSKDQVVGIVEQVSLASGTVRVKSMNPHSDEVEIIRICQIDHVRAVLMGDFADCPYTVLNNHLSIKIEGDGSWELNREELIVPNSPGLESYRDVYLSSLPWDTGTVWARIREADVDDSWIPGKIEPLEPGEQFTSGYEIAQRFTRPLVRGRRYIRSSGATYPKGMYLVDERDSFDHTARHAEQRFAVEISFPTGLAPAGVSVTRITQLAMSLDLGSRPVENGTAVLSVDDPQIGDRYVIEWSNSSATRKKVAPYREAGVNG